MKKAILAFMLLVPVSAYAGPRQELEKFLSTPTAQSAALVQTAGNSRVTGSIAVARGGKVRWEEWRGNALETLVVSDGARSWLYEPGLEQATRLQPSSSGWAGILQDPKRLERDYIATESGQVLTFKPRSGELLPATLEFKAGKPSRLTTQDIQGKKMTVVFGAWKPAPRAQFTFSPPKGTDIVDQR